MHPPKLCDSIFSTAVAEGAHIAICHWALSQHYGLPLVLLDFHSAQFRADCWGEAMEFQVAAAERCRAIYGAIGAWVETEALAQQANASGFPARPIPDWIAHKDYWPRLVTFANGKIRSFFYADGVSAGQVKMTDEALAHANRQAFAGANYGGGERPTDDPKRACEAAAFLYGITIALDESAKIDPKQPMVAALTRGVAAQTAKQVASIL